MDSRIYSSDKVADDIDERFNYAFRMSESRYSVTSISSVTETENAETTYVVTTLVEKMTSSQRVCVIEGDAASTVGADEGREETIEEHNATQKSLEVRSSADDSAAPNVKKISIWPALETLNLSLSAMDGETTASADRAVTIEHLLEHFSVSPRRFTEDLLTIIEESFVPEDESSSDRFIELLKRAEGAERPMDDQTTPRLVISETSNEIADVTTSSGMNVDDLPHESTQYRSIERRAIPKSRGKKCHVSMTIYLHQPAPEVTGGFTSTRTNSRTPDESRVSSAISKKLKSPSQHRKTPRISMAHRLRVGSAGGIEKSPERGRRNFPKTPKIVINPPSPFPSSTRRVKWQQTPSKYRADDEDEEYLTADSDVDETVEFEPAAASSRKLDMSALAQSHRKWVEAYEKVEPRGVFVSRKMSVTRQQKSLSRANEATSSLASHQDKLTQRRLRQLRQRRQNCFDLVEQLLGNKQKTATDRRSAFWETLVACSKYYACGVNATHAPPEPATGRARCISKLMVSLRGKTKSPRRSLGHNKIAKVRSPGGRRIGGTAPKSPAFLKKPLLRDSAQSPAIDRSSIRTVAQLRRVFSPLPKIKESRSPGTTVQVMPLPGKRKKFSRVKSPVRQYIRGNN